ncbi:hypothetical protein OY671_008012, partial [Metschnikowia pulcherrima]
MTAAVIYGKAFAANSRGEVGKSAAAFEQQAG